jgi:hypothetical protein
VTVGSLQVTCSKLGISLRRPRLDNGIRFLPRGKPVPSNGRSTSDPRCDVSVPLQPIGEGARQDSQPGPPERTWNTTRRQQRPELYQLADLNRCRTSVSAQMCLTLCRGVNISGRRASEGLRLPTAAEHPSQFRCGQPFERDPKLAGGWGRMGRCGLNGSDGQQGEDHSGVDP